jgi:hypothetical protein
MKDEDPTGLGLHASPITGLVHIVELQYGSHVFHGSMDLLS